jgi:hypothetical protein
VGLANPTGIAAALVLIALRVFHQRRLSAQIQLGRARMIDSAWETRSSAQLASSQHLTCAALERVRLQ